MRPVFTRVVIVLAFILTACQSDEKEATPVKISDQWKLIKSRSGWTGQESTPQSLGYDEYYDFRSDSTFIKYRSTGAETSGTYSIRHDTVRIYFTKETDLAKLSLQSGCFNRSSFLVLDVDNQLVENSLACDGPTSFYRKVGE